MRRPLARALDDWRFTIDRRLGRGLSRAVTAHHRRRLTRIGWERALDAPAGGWADGDPPLRAGCSIEVLIDGEQMLPRLAADLERAQSHVYLAGWQFSPGFALVRDEQPVILRNLLADLAERIDVCVLAWAGAPLPLFRPSRAAVRQCRDNLRRGTRIRVALDAKERPLHCHHEKTVVVDGRVAFVGGIDLTYESGDRFDSNAHVARGDVGWHDVAARIEGPAVADVAAHFRMRWREVTGEVLAAPDTPAARSVGDTAVQIVRTVPESVYSSARRGDFRILESYMRALRGARTLIYLENQFLWSPEIGAVLCEKLRRPPSDDFRLLLLLPAKPNNGLEDTRGLLAELVEADGGAGRVLACTLYARHGLVSDAIYVHAKVGIVDDGWMTIGSANLNEHSLFNDTELNVVSQDGELVRATRLRLWAEHLELPVDAIGGDPAAVVDRHWKPIADEQRARRDANLHLTHRLVRLPHLSKRAERLQGPVQGLLVDG